MRDPRIEKLAELIAGYSLDLQEGQVYRIDGEDVSAPLAVALYAAAIRRGAHPYTKITPSGLEEIALEEASDEQLAYIPELEQIATEQLDAWTSLWGTVNTRSLTRVGPRAAATAALDALPDGEQALGADQLGRPRLVRDALPDAGARPGRGDVALRVRGFRARRLPHA